MGGGGGGAASLYPDKKIAFQNKLYGSTDQRGFRRAYKWGGGGGGGGGGEKGGGGGGVGAGGRGGGGGGGKLKPGGLVSGQKTAFQNFVKQDSLKSVQSSLLGD